MTRSIGELSKQAQRQTYYDILGVPMGASIDHIKDSYRLLTKKSPDTDAAYEVLTDPRQRRRYDSESWTERGATQVPAEQEGEYYVTHDDTGWHVIGDNEVGWELESFLPDRRVRLKAPRLLFGPFFSKREAEQVAEKKKQQTASKLETADKRTNNDPWIEWGAPREMPKKPPLLTHTELYYIAGIEKMLRSGTLPDRLPDTVMDYTPEQLFEVCDISIETESDANSFIQYVQWLSDLIAWVKSLPVGLATPVAENLAQISKGRYKFLVPLL